MQNLSDKVSTFQRNTGLVHIDRLEKLESGNTKGHRLVLVVIRTMKVKNDHGGYDTVNTRANIESSIHFSLNKFEGFNTFGFNGDRVKGIPLGKLTELAAYRDHSHGQVGQLWLIPNTPTKRWLWSMPC